MRYIMMLFLLFLLTEDAFSQALRDSTKNCCDTTTNNKEGISAKFPGGNEVWRRWFYKWLYSKKFKVEESNLRGKCQHNFLIDTSGKIIEVNFCSMQGTYAETIIRYILSQSPLWEAAIDKNGMKIQQRLCQTISFELEK
jgi:hypothetical protein